MSKGWLGEILVDYGLNREYLEGALKEQKKSEKTLGKILLELGYITEDELASALAKQAGIEKIDLKGIKINPEVLGLVPACFARDHKIIPLSTEDNSLTIAMANPFDIMTIEDLEQMTNLRVDIKAATKTAILEAIDQYYEEETRAEREQKEDLTDVAPVVQVVNQTIEKAIREGATDIHFEPKEKEIYTRFRIDGILHRGPRFPKELQSAIMTRIKIMAGLNISESRLPQDGKIVFYVDGKEIDIRVSTMPSIYGEKIVLRILDKEKLVLSLEKLGFSTHNLEIFKESIQRPYGIILVCGPTGSGKTTTLYTSLAYINSMEKNIVTLEDPVEYEFPDISQSQINLKAGFTFASGLRTLLRQDPDVILVGEMRDPETVEVAMRAAITGHLVFSTLHTNDAVGAITRLLDMGVKPYLLSSSLQCIVAQRLVRKICPYCKEVVEPRYDILDALAPDRDWTDTVFYRGRGCDKCYGTGYKGRIAISEILSITPSISSMIVHGADSMDLKEKAMEEEMITMLEDGLEKASAGITTIEEVARVVS